MNDNETVAEVLAEYGKNIELMRKCKCVGVSLWNCLKFKLRIEAANNRKIAAHKREIADFQRRYDECVRKFNEADLERVRLRDEVAAKDAEILSLKRTLKTAARWVMTHDIYGNMTKDILDDAKKLLDDDGKFLG